MDGQRELDMIMYLGPPNYYILGAAALCVLLGLVHSILGEVLIFRRWRSAPPKLPLQHQGIIRATWHITTLLAFIVAVLLQNISSYPMELAMYPFWRWTIVGCFGACSLLVLWLTKARHPGWIILLIITGCVALA